MDLLFVEGGRRVLGDLLHFGSILNGGCFVRCVLGLLGFLVLELDECAFNITRHGQVNVAMLIVPLEGDATK